MVVVAGLLVPATEIPATPPVILKLLSLTVDPE
jgi:hypothetical protein